eukprot:COSAG02_NODE_9193_length_2294_cov_199.669704_1_plen_161_part_00
MMCEDMEVCCLTTFSCWMWSYGTSRERAGIMACLPSAMHILPFVVIAIALYIYAMVMYSIPYQECIAYHPPSGICAHNNPFGWQMDPQCNPCYDQYEAMQKFTNMNYIAGLAQACIMCVILGGNRQKLQVALGMPDAGPVNYILCAHICLLPTVPFRFSS